MLSGEQTRLALALAVEGVMGYYARATAVRLEDCEKIEAVRMEVLRMRGLESGEARISMHASRVAGGQEHRHAYQYAVAALAAQFDEVLHAQEGSPERTAMWAHVRNEYLRIGWDGEGEMLEWHPEWAEGQLDEDRVVHAWLLGRLRTGLRIKSGDRRGQRGGPEERGEGGSTGDRGRGLWGAGGGRVPGIYSGERAAGSGGGADVGGRQQRTRKVEDVGGDKGSVPEGGGRKGR